MIAGYPSLQRAGTLLVIINGIEMTKLQNNTKFLKHLRLNGKAQQCNQQMLYAPQLQYASQQSHDAPIVPQQSHETPTSLDSGLIIPTLNSTDDLIESLNKAMLFLSKAFTTRYPPTNKQLKISSNPKTQTNIQNGRVTIQSVPTRQTQSYANNNGKAKATGTHVIKNARDYARANV
ncbi:hypothetical protein Tco_0590562 [Tanacetum coccineum]